MLKSVLSSFILIVGFANSIWSQQVRPLPNPIITIQCGQQTLLRHTRLTTPSANQPIPASCTYRFNALSFNVCQLRIVFTKLSMSGPVLDSSLPGIAYQRCNGDNFNIGNITLCGENSGQHIYIPFNPRQGERQLTITINTANGNANGATRPQWDIAVHQLECGHGQSRSLSAIEPASADEQHENIRSPRTFFTEWIAPAGCLQYFIERTGQIDTFNFNNGVGPYIGDMNYAICIRRLRNDRSLKLVPTFFRMNSGNPTSGGFNEDCLFPITTPQRSEDYLFIPNAETDEVPPTRARLFCGQSMNSRIITSTPPGPFMITFNSDKEYSQTEEIGFRMRYEIV